jgi:hypothetical protein
MFNNHSARNMMRSILLSLLLGGGLDAAFVASSLADSGTGTVLSYTNGTRITAGSPVVGGTRYGRIIRL